MGTTYLIADIIYFDLSSLNTLFPMIKGNVGENLVD